MPANVSPFILSLIVAQILFGIHYVTSKVLLNFFPPLVWASVRSFSAALIFVLIALSLKKLDWKRAVSLFRPLMLFAFLGTSLNQGLFLMGLHHTTATNSALLNTLIPIFTLMLVGITGREKIALRQIWGLGFAFLGVMAMHGVENFSLSDKTWLGDLLTMLNCASYAVFLAYSRPFIQANDRLWCTTWFFVYGSLGISAMALPEWSHFHWPALTLTAYLAGAFSILGGTVLTYLLINYSLAHLEASKVSLFVYIQPIIAALLNWFWKHEAIDQRTIVSASLIFIGVLLAVRKPRSSLSHPQTSELPTRKAA